MKQFPSKDLSWIDNIFPEVEGVEIEGEGQAESNPNDRVSADNMIDNKNADVIEIRVEESEDVPPLCDLL